MFVVILMIFAGLKEGERWVKTGFKGGMFCIDTSIFDNLHRAYYGPELRIKSHSNFLKRMLINGASEREAKSLYCDILAEMYYRLYKKERKWSWEKEWRSICIGATSKEDSTNYNKHDCSKVDHC